MHYLTLLPSLIAAAALSMIDARTRTVPRVVVACGALTQLAVFLLVSPVPRGLAKAGMATGLGGVCFLIQLALCLAFPTAIGLGDATTAFLLGLAVGYAGGLSAVIMWWFLMGILGLAALGIQQLRKRNSVPFVPIMSAEALLSVLLC